MNQTAPLSPKESEAANRIGYRLPDHSAFRELTVAVRIVDTEASRHGTRVDRFGKWFAIQTQPACCGGHLKTMSRTARRIGLHLPILLLAESVHKLRTLRTLGYEQHLWDRNNFEVSRGSGIWLDSSSGSKRARDFLSQR